MSNTITNRENIDNDDYVGGQQISQRPSNRVILKPNSHQMGILMEIFICGMGFSSC